MPFGAGHPHAVSELTKAIPFNDADVLERVLDDIGDRVAALILEPAMMNITIVAPTPGYLERVRELTAKHGVVLVFDEVKTGATIAAGGAVERFGVQPDVVCLAKAIAGGYPGGAVGMTETLADLITTGSVRQVGTFNGNPLSMAAAQAALTEVLTAEAYAALRGARRAPARRPRRRHRALRPAVPHGRPRLQGLRRLLLRAALRVPRLRDEGRRGALDARLAVPHEPRHLHDAGRRRAVDAVASPTATTSCSATWTPIEAFARDVTA